MVSSKHICSYHKDHFNNVVFSEVPQKNTECKTNYAATTLRSATENFQPTFEHSVIHNTNRCASKYNSTPPSHICCFIGRKNNIILNGIIINFGLCHLNQSFNYSLYNNAPPNFHWCWTNFILLVKSLRCPCLFSVHCCYARGLWDEGFWP